MLSWGSEGQVEGHLDSYSISQAELMQVLCNDHCDRKHFVGLLLQNVAQKCTSNRTQTTAQRHKLRHLSVTLSVYATSLLCPLFITSLRALSTSCSLSWPKEEWCQVHHTLDWWMLSTHLDMSLPLNNQCNVARTSALCPPWRQLVKHLAHARSVSCKTRLRLSLRS